MSFVEAVSSFSIMLDTPNGSITQINPQTLSSRSIRAGAMGYNAPYKMHPSTPVCHPPSRSPATLKLKRRALGGIVDIERKHCRSHLGYQPEAVAGLAHGLNLAHGRDLGEAPCFPIVCL